MPASWSTGSSELNLAWLRVRHGPVYATPAGRTRRLTAGHRRSHARMASRTFLYSTPIVTATEVVGAADRAGRPGRAALGARRAARGVIAAVPIGKRTALVAGRAAAEAAREIATRRERRWAHALTGAILTRPAWITGVATGAAVVRIGGYVDALVIATSVALWTAVGAALHLSDWYTLAFLALKAWTPAVDVNAPAAKIANLAGVTDGLTITITAPETRIAAINRDAGSINAIFAVSTVPTISLAALTSPLLGSFVGVEWIKCDGRKVYLRNAITDKTTDSEAYIR